MDGSLTVNGRKVELSLDRPRSLLHVLREELGLTGPKYGCGEGQCGVCTVLVDGRPVQACGTELAAVVGRSIRTIEGFATEGRLSPLQRAFAELGAFQCGYCTPGMIAAAEALLASEPNPSEGRIAEALEGHVCRCGVYSRIVRAVRRAVELSDAPPAAAQAPAPAPELASGGVPWDLLEPSARSYFERLGDGLLSVEAPAMRGWPPAGGAWIHLGADGVATAFTGKVEMGQGAATGMALLVAEELRLPLSAVRVVHGDTDHCPWDVGTFGSMSIAVAGRDLRAAAARLRERLASLGGELRGRRELVSAGPAPLTPAAAWRVAGHDAARASALDVVTGAKRYPSDLSRPGLLHGAVLRPPAYGATLRSVDGSRARALPGVTLVEEEGFVGVACGDLGVAREAVRAIQSEWELSPQPSEGELEEWLRAHPVEAAGWERAVHEERGDPAKALAAAEVRLSASYRTAYLAHVPIEPRGALAEWGGGRLTVWLGTQTPFELRETLAEALAIAQERIRVVAVDFGDGFGGKHADDVALEAARLARATQRPVKVLWSREEEFRWGHFRPAAFIDVRSGANRDGRIVAWDFRCVNGGPSAVRPPYDFAHQSVHFQPALAPLAQGPYRALAATTNNFARESHLDEIAHAIGFDPLELRLRQLRDDRTAAVLRAAAERAGWSRREERYLGLAAGVEKGGRVATVAEVALEAGTPRVRRIVTAYDCGAVVNPDGVRSQIEGATTMGLGGALFEAVHFERGRLSNPKLSLYRLPRFSDLPAVETVLVNRPDDPPAGAGEVPLIALAPAIANAIFAATGERRRAMPLFGPPPAG